MAVTTKPSPFAPSELPALPPIDGVRLATAAAGVRYADRTDVMLALLEEGTVAAGVTTRSKTCAAPVLWCRQQLQHGRARALIVNAGNANAFTGAKGSAAVDATVNAVAQAVGCHRDAVFVASTGVIGEPMEAARIIAVVDKLTAAAAPGGWEAAARAIMTTDTFPKLAQASANVAGVDVTVGGFCKGAGMIAPDMATMLGFVFTDAAIAQPVLQRLVAAIADRTFNCTTVDGDTSTSDTVLAFATGAARRRGAPVINDMADAACGAFATALHAVMRDLALQVVRDGEGLSKFVAIHVSGAEDDRAARRIALAIANSPIVKTAIAGEDPNWGRVVMAVGKAGEAADRDRLAIWFGPHQVACDGERAAGYVEQTVASYMQRSEIELRVDVGVGAGGATVWTCDLTHGYISINADYRS